MRQFYQGVNYINRCLRRQHSLCQDSFPKEPDGTQHALKPGFDLSSKDRAEAAPIPPAGRGQVSLTQPAAPARLSHMSSGIRTRRRGRAVDQAKRLAGTPVPAPDVLALAMHFTCTPREGGGAGQPRLGGEALEGGGPSEWGSAGVSPPGKANPQPCPQVVLVILHLRWLQTALEDAGGTVDRAPLCSPSGWSADRQPPQQRAQRAPARPVVAEQGEHRMGLAERARGCLLCPPPRLPGRKPLL